jgi:signal transduction histidine kinase
VEGLPFVRLQIANDGESIPFEAREAVFEQYSQLGDIDTGKPCGVGVGLALVKAIVGRMQGRVFLELRQEEGTAFCLLLPTAEAYKALNRHQ